MNNQYCNENLYSGPCDLCSRKRYIKIEYNACACKLIKYLSVGKTTICKLKINKNKSIILVGRVFSICGSIILTFLQYSYIPTDLCPHKPTNSTEIN